jgi:flagellar biosynthesis/type III secretory pathway protein FliH
MSEEFLTLEETQQMVQKAVSEAKAQAVRETEARMKPPVQQVIQKVDTILDEFSQFRRDLFKEAEIEVIELVRRVSKRVLNFELSLKPELLQSVVEKALEGLVTEKRIVISFSPTDEAQFKAFHPQFLETALQKPELEFKPEAQIPAGTVWIRTESVEMEVQIEKMVDEILGQVLGAVQSAKETGDEGDKI